MVAANTRGAAEVREVSRLTSRQRSSNFIIRPASSHANYDLLDTEGWVALLEMSRPSWHPPTQGFPHRVAGPNENDKELFVTQTSFPRINLLVAGIPSQYFHLRDLTEV